MRKLILWLTGSDLLDPMRNLPQPPYRLAGINGLTPNWKVTIVPRGGLVLHVQHGPFFLHRWAQRIAFGFKWEML